ncbi:DNA-protecting protein DprA [Peribacillus cavernae]|uniref:DNA-protecting protein DprA n=1 Tax=Peribacillus cavernae TaxID=1674310 RepID=A0A3S0U590_9BACI|nr:DNA-processing protein DprA [Peribacillus cavernae]MDQ0217088.1 DNA processing protein [Peribacillus cavernae]RUQ30435.1 DNA-protecting protein DprA [Peribacillus cavernae]
MNIREKLIHLHHCRGIGWKAIRKVLKHDPALTSLYDWPMNTWQEVLPLTLPKLQLFLEDLHSIDIEKLIRQYSANQIDCMTIMDDDYPFLLKQIFDPPWVLYVKGQRDLLAEAPALGVVGARKPSSYGIEALKMILPPLVQKGYVIISGAATGIDALSHKLSLYQKGKTIGVLGGGHFYIYPKENIPLAIAIMKEGLLISEVPPGRRPEPWMFPMRNRIISGLSQGVFIIEAKQNSGSLITAQYALEHGREVFALPGNVTSELSLGSNLLIQDGAKPVLQANDIETEMSSGIH